MQTKCGYVTDYVKLHDKYAQNMRGKVYWLETPCGCTYEGFVLLIKNWQGSYNLRKFLGMSRADLEKIELICNSRIEDKVKIFGLEMG